MTSQLRDGDPSALGPLFDHYRGHLERMVRFRLHPKLQGRIDTSDIVQQVYIEAAGRLDHFTDSSSKCSFLAWLRQVTEQCLVDACRRHLGAQKRDARREQPIHGLIAKTSRQIAINLVGQLTSPSMHAVRAEFEATL
ncbi:MAG: ECF-type sigma factor, partial [Planctomycetales bacterium]